MRGPLSRLTGEGNWFEDFEPGQKLRHARGATIDEVENNFLSKQVMNTAQAHWNEHFLQGSPLGDGRVVFGLITASVTIGLASQDTSENALAELSLDKLRFHAPVHQGDTVYTYTEVLAVAPARRPRRRRARHVQALGSHARRPCRLRGRTHAVGEATEPLGGSVIDHTTAHEVAAPMAERAHRSLAGRAGR